MKTYSVGAVIFPGFEMLDYYGPLELFSMHREALSIQAVAQVNEPVSASGGPATLPDVTFGEGADFDILLVPGGAGTREQATNPVLLTWLSEAAARAKVVSSVCTGSLLLAKAGLLDDRKATTNKNAFNWVADQCPSVQWQGRARWVKDGKFYTSSGVSAGMDMALDIIADLLGAGAATDAARWAEYVQNSDADNDPFAVEGQTS